MPTMLPAFILYAIDDALLYPCLGARFETGDLDKLGKLLAIDKASDPEITRNYTLNRDEMRSVCDAFRVPFDSAGTIFTLHRHDPAHDAAGYLLHNGYELPLLLQGRKKLAVMHFDSAYPRSLELKARFDRYVAEGQLHAQGEWHEIEPGSTRRAGDFLYTPQGEAWRVHALELVRRSARHGEGWSETHERLVGMLMGYADWENDRWLEFNANGGGVIYGLSLRCAVSKAGYEWVMHSGCRALPPATDETLTVHYSHALDDNAMQTAFAADPHIEAFVQFNIAGKHLMRIADLRDAAPFAIPAPMLPEINEKLTRRIQVLAHRTDAACKTNE